MQNYRNHVKVNNVCVLIKIKPLKTMHKLQVYITSALKAEMIFEFLFKR